MMRRLLLIIALLLIVPLPLQAQQGNTVLILFPGVPTGTCSFNMLAIDNATGDLYDCDGGTWNKIGPGAAGAVTWNSILDPTGAQSLAMANFLTDWVFGAATGAGLQMFDLRDTTGNTGTGYVLSVSTTGTSAAKAIRITDGGLVNGVEMNTTGVLLAIGTGSILADSLTDGALATVTGDQTLWDSTNATRTLTFGLSGATDPVVTLADGVFNLTTGTLQQDGDDVIHKDTNTLLSTENVILDGSTNPRDITLGIIRILQTPNMDSTRGIAVITDAAGFGDTKSLEVDWTATAVAAGDFEAVINLDIDTANSTGGNIIGLEITEVGTGSATTYGMLTGVGVNPILNEAGVFGDVETAFTFDSVFTDVTADFNSSASDVQMFVSNGDLVYIGMAALFDEVEFILAITASNAGIQPTFEYSDGASGWITFSPTDNTNGMRQNGDLVWIATSLAGWAQDTVNSISGKFWIRITRGAVTVATPPTEDLVQVNNDLDFMWDSSGNLNIASLSSGFNQEIADSGFIRVANDEDFVCAERATPGADVCGHLNTNDDWEWQRDIAWHSGTAFIGTITHANSADRAYDFPDSSGEVSLLGQTIDLGSGEITGTVAIGNGGTGQTAREAAYDALSPNTTEGDLTFRNATVNTRLPRGANGECLTSNTTTILWGSCGGGGASWSTLTDPTGAITMNSNGNTELVSMLYTSALGATDVAFTIEQLTGDVLAGSILLEVTAADTDILLMSMGAGANTIDVTQAGAMTAEGTASITATVGDSATAFFTAGEIEKLHLPDVEGLDTALTANRCVRVNAGGTALEADTADCNSGSGANTALSNLAAVAINLPLLPDAAAADDFGSATLPFKDLFLAGSSGTPGTNNFRITGASTSGTRVFTVVDAASNSVVPNTGSANNFVTAIAATGVVSIAQPAFTNISGTATNAQGGTGIDTSSSTGVMRVDTGTTTVTELSGDVATSGSNATLIQAGVVASAELATANKTFSKSIDILDPTTTETNMIQWMHGSAVTYTQIDCSTDVATSTVTIDMDHRVLITPNTVGTDIITGTVVCDTDNQQTTSFADATIPANVPVNLSITATANTPTVVRIHITYSKD